METIKQDSGETDGEWQLRSSQGPPASSIQITSNAMYPLSLDERLRQGDQFRAAKPVLEHSLQQIEKFFSSPEAGPHAGPPSCSRCQRKQQAIRTAYYTYYTTTPPYAAIPEYRDELNRRFNSPEEFPLDHIHALFTTALREHLKQDLCAAGHDDPWELSQLKSTTRTMIDTGLSMEDVLDNYLKSLPPYPDHEAIQYDNALQHTSSPEQRAQIYIKYYCTIHNSDPPDVKNFKNKYARIFGELKPHDEVLKEMRREAAVHQASRISTLREDLASAKLAQKGHLKDKAKKEEVKTENQEKGEIRDGDAGRRDMDYASCGLYECQKEIPLGGSEEIVECAFCEWLDGKENRKGDGRVYYCSVAHAEEDFAHHDHDFHACTTKDHCIYYPKYGPPETGKGGVCRDCADAEMTSYFCSQECYAHNLDDHRHYHAHNNIRNDSDILELFKAAPDMEIIS